MIQVIVALAVVLVAPAALSFTSPTPTQKSRLGLRFNDGDKDEFRDYGLGIQGPGLSAYDPVSLWCFKSIRGGYIRICRGMTKETEIC